MCSNKKLRILWSYLKMSHAVPLIISTISYVIMTRSCNTTLRISGKYLHGSPYVISMADSMSLGALFMIWGCWLWVAACNDSATSYIEDKQFEDKQMMARNAFAGSRQEAPTAPMVEIPVTCYCYLVSTPSGFPIRSRFGQGLSQTFGI
jgi:hypothetical protein